MRSSTFVAIFSIRIVKSLRDESSRWMRLVQTCVINTTLGSRELPSANEAQLPSEVFPSKLSWNVVDDATLLLLHVAGDGAIFFFFSSPRIPDSPTALSCSGSSLMAVTHIYFYVIQPSSRLPLRATNVPMHLSSQ